MATKKLPFRKDERLENNYFVNNEIYKGEWKIENKIGQLALNSPKLIESSSLYLFGGDNSDVDKKMIKLKNLGPALIPRNNTSIQSRDNTTLGKNSSADIEHRRRSFPNYNYQPSPYPKDFPSDEENFDQCNYVIPKKEEKPRRVARNDRVSHIRRTLMQSSSSKRSGRRHFSKGKTFGAGRKNLLKKSFSKKHSMKKKNSVRSILKKGLTRYSKSSYKKSNTHRSQFKKVGFETKKTIFCYNPRRKIRIEE